MHTTHQCNSALTSTALTLGNGFPERLRSYSRPIRAVYAHRGFVVHTASLWAPMCSCVLLPNQPRGFPESHFNRAHIPKFKFRQARTRVYGQTSPPSGQCCYYTPSVSAALSCLRVCTLKTEVNPSRSGVCHLPQCRGSQKRWGSGTGHPGSPVQHECK